MTYRLALLDLDGTLTDSAPAITASVRAAYAAMGVPAPDDATLRTFVGPPIWDNFTAHGVPPELVETGIAAYRADYAERATRDAVLYPGIARLLTALRAAGLRTAVATSKPEPTARRVVAHFGLDVLVDGVFGATFDQSRASKAAVVAHALDSLDAWDLVARGEVVMVGDRHHDVLGSRAHGVECVAVTWGYAPPGELDAAAPLATVASVDELRALLTAGHGGTGPVGAA
ncbi:HAD hydrolase-like protein [Cellulomonas sp. NPDC055163]